MIIKKFGTGENIEVNNFRELKNILKLCNPSMIKYYKQQLPQLDIDNFGESIKIKVK